MGDLRTKKTKNLIRYHFIELLKKKDIHQITIIELSHLAQINKSTFYRHYEDIYELYKELRNILIKNITSSNPNLENLLSNPDLFFEGDKNALLQYKNQIDILFKNDMYTFSMMMANELANYYIDNNTTVHDQMVIHLITNSIAIFFIDNVMKIEDEKVKVMIESIQQLKNILSEVYLKNKQ